MGRSATTATTGSHTSYNALGYSFAVVRLALGIPGKNNTPPAVAGLRNMRTGRKDGLPAVFINLTDEPMELAKGAKLPGPVARTASTSRIST